MSDIFLSGLLLYPLTWKVISDQSAPHYSKLHTTEDLTCELSSKVNLWLNI